MSLVVVSDYVMSASEARAITDQIKEHTDAVWKLLTLAHEGRAWKPLGYETWAEYVAGEFSMSRAYSYRLLDQGRVIHAIEEALSPMGDIPVELSEREARDIKPVLEAVVEQAREAVADLGPAPEPAAVQAVVEEVVQSHRPAPEQSWSPETGFNAHPFTGELIEPAPVVTAPLSLPPVPKLTKPMKVQNAEQLSQDFANSIRSLVRTTTPEGRQVILDAWGLGEEACTPDNRNHTTAAWFRIIARGLNSLANEWETK